MTLRDDIKGFTGLLYKRPATNNNKSAGQFITNQYELRRYQYASSSLPDEQLKPAAIAYANSIADIIAVVRYALKHDIAVAVRTGGHQYGGASSTNGDNLQLDLSNTFNTGGDFHYDAENNSLKIGVSFSLETLDEKLSRFHCMLPHGICCNVRVGGHTQTGGYGMFTRSLGLFADQVVGFGIVVAAQPHPKLNKLQNRRSFFGLLTGNGSGSSGTSNYDLAATANDNSGSKAVASNSNNSGSSSSGSNSSSKAHDEVDHLTVTKKSHPDLYFAVLGGGPGNFGVLTHVYFKPILDADYPGSCALGYILPYKPELLQILMETLINFGNDSEAIAGCDVILSVVSGQDKSRNNGGLDDTMRLRHKAVFGSDNIPASDLVHTTIWLTATSLTANNPIINALKAIADKAVPTPYIHVLQAPIVGSANHGSANHGSAAPLSASTLPLTGDQHIPLSAINQAFMWRNVREFDLPYIKRKYNSAGPLEATKFAAWLADRVTTIVTTTNVKLVMQFHWIGGRHSQLAGHKANGTAFSWRNTRYGVVLETFYDNSADEAAVTDLSSAVGNVVSDNKTTSAKSVAEAWHHTNDNELLQFGLSDDKRLIWHNSAHSEVDTDMSQSWPYYHSPPIYHRLLAIKQQYDPKNVFSANRFALRCTGGSGGSGGRGDAVSATSK